MTPTETYFAERDIAGRVDALGIDDRPAREKLTTGEQFVVALLAGSSAVVYTAAGYGLGCWVGWWR